MSAYVEIHSSMHMCEIILIDQIQRVIGRTLSKTRLHQPDGIFDQQFINGLYAAACCYNITVNNAFPGLTSH